MPKVFRDVPVDIPNVKGIVITHSVKRGKIDNRIFFDAERKYDPQKKYAVPTRRITIGYCADEPGKMYPNKNFTKIFPNEWRLELAKRDDIKVEADQDENIPFHLKVGLYAIVFLICSTFNITVLLQGIWGPVQTCAILDFVLYSITYGKSSAHSFQDYMSDSMLFSDKILDEDYYSGLFKNLSRECIEKFLIGWTQACLKLFSLSSVWLIVDGSNLDSQCKNVDLCEQGHNKSRTHKNIISFSFAVTSFGLPIYYEVYRGGLVDAKALTRIIDFLTQHNIAVKGIILDRGYCTEDCLDYLRYKHINFKVILKSNTEGFKKLVLGVGKDIRLNANNLIKGTNLFGIQQKTKLFKSSKYESYVSLFFNIDKFGRKFNKFIQKYNTEFTRLLNAIKNGEKDIKVSSDMKDFFTIIDNDGKKEIACNVEKLQLEIDQEGFFAVASNIEDSAEETYNIIQSKIYVEKGFMALKSELGYDSMRVQNIERIYGKFFVAFVACIVRFFLFSNAKKVGLDTNSLIRKLNLLEIIRDKVFTYPHQESKDICKLISNLGGSDEIFDDAKDRANKLYYGQAVSLRYRKTRTKSKKKIIELDENLNPIPRKRGVPVGTKRSDTNKDGSPRKKPGPKPKNVSNAPDVKPSTDSSPDQTVFSPDSVEKEQGNSTAKKRGVPKGTKRGDYNKDGSLRQKPGPKPKNGSNLSVDTASTGGLDLQSATSPAPVMTDSSAHATASVDSPDTKVGSSSDLQGNNTAEKCGETAIYATSTPATMTDDSSAHATASADSSDSQLASSSDLQGNTSPKKRGVPKGTKRGAYNKDGSLRQKPGPKIKNGSNLSGDTSSTASSDLRSDTTAHGTATPAALTDSRSATEASSVDSPDTQLASSSDLQGNTTPKKRGVPKGTKRGTYNKDGSLRQKPGPKIKNGSNLSGDTSSTASSNLRSDTAAHGTATPAALTDSQSATEASSVDDMDAQTLSLPLLRYAMG